MDGGAMCDQVMGERLIRYHTAILKLIIGNLYATFFLSIQESMRFIQKYI